MRTRVIKYLKSASAVMLMGWALLSTSADAQGIVLTGGSLSLDFGDPNIGGNSTTLDRLDKLTWSGGDGALAGQTSYRTPAAAVATAILRNFGANPTASPKTPIR